MIGVVLDTSTLVSAIGWKASKPRKILDKCLRKELILLTSPKCLEELKDVLFRKKFDFISKDTKEELLLLLSDIAEIVIPKTRINICRDKKDNKFIELALYGKANYIVSSDDDLLALKMVNNIEIINPSKFLKLF